MLVMPSVQRVERVCGELTIDASESFASTSCNCARGDCSLIEADPDLKTVAEADMDVRWLWSRYESACNRRVRSEGIAPDHKCNTLPAIYSSERCGKITSQVGVRESWRRELDIGTDSTRAAEQGDCRRNLPSARTRLPIRTSSLWSA
jgi:hypothetical protein